MTPVESVIAREEEFHASQTASDVVKLDEIMSDSLTRFVHTTGAVDTKAEYLAAVRSGRYRHGPITRLHGQTCVFGDAAFSLSVVDMVSKPQDAPEFSMRFHEVLVWAREANGWRFTAPQATKNML